MKQLKQHEEGEIRIGNVSKVMIEDLMNIAKNTGFGTLNQFLKVKLTDIRDSYPVDKRRNDREE